MLRLWYQQVGQALRSLKKELYPLAYGNLLALMLRIAGLALLYSGVLSIVFQNEVSWFLKLAPIIGGILLTAISKTLLWLSQSSRLAKHFMSAIDFLSVSFSGAFFAVVLGHFYLGLPTISADGLLSLKTLCIGALLGNLIYLAFLKGIVANDTHKRITLYCCLALLPYRLLASLAPSQKQLHTVLVASGSSLIFLAIFASFYIGDMTSKFIPKTFNVYFLAMLFFIFLIHVFLDFIISQLRLEDKSTQENFVKFFMTWGMAVTMLIFYLFDWKLLLGGNEGWDIATRNSVLWAFTIYRLITSVKDITINF